MKIYQLKVFLVLCGGPTGTWNQNLRPLLDSFQCHESNGGLKIDKRASFENHVFRWFTWNFNILTSGALFWKSIIPLDSCWRVEFKFKLKSLFLPTDKKLIFWTILPIKSKIWNWNSGVAVNARKVWLDSYNR